MRVSEAISRDVTTISPTRLFAMFTGWLIAGSITPMAGLGLAMGAVQRASWRLKKRDSVMIQFQKILVPVDFSNAKLIIAQWLCHLLNELGAPFATEAQLEEDNSMVLAWRSC